MRTCRNKNVQIPAVKYDTSTANPGGRRGGEGGGYLPQLTISVYAALKGIVLIWSGKGICFA